MWRLVASELADKSVYKGQRIMLMNTIKAQIKAIYAHGCRMQSAFFGKGTKPIFRSESARYVVFVQMSKEMWDFEPEGTGDLIFNKVINGFLPELFGKWQDIGARHLVSIVLFTRIEYEEEIGSTLKNSESFHEPDICTRAGKLPYKDFYRVLVSDMASGQWAAVITQLKREFKTFLKDVSIRAVSSKNKSTVGRDAGSRKSSEWKDIIVGRPAPATRGNILEAINVASSQFSYDYINRDLVRTGLSIIIVTPGTGTFEVDPNLLSLTTDVLIENGVGIDLVCLSRMPLHSVPLFKYRHQACPNAETPFGHVTDLVRGGELQPSHGPTTQDEHTEWRYAIPHWIDVSFWSSGNESVMFGNRPTRAELVVSGPRSFVPRVRMYEVQMMGIMENEMSNISMPYLHQFATASPEKELIKGGASLSRRDPVSNTISPSRKLKVFGANGSYISNTLLSPSGSPYGLGSMEAFGVLSHWTDEYDNTLFKHNLQRVRLHRSSRSVRKELAGTLGKERQLRGTHIDSQIPNALKSWTPEDGHQGSSSTSHIYRRVQHSERRDDGSEASLFGQRSHAKPSRLSRQVSLGFRGLGGAVPKAIPVTELSSEVAHPESLLPRGIKSGPLSAIPRSSKPTRRRDATMKTFNNTWDETEEESSLARGQSPDSVSKPVSIVSDLLENSKFKGREHERIPQARERSPPDTRNEDLDSSEISLPHKKAFESWLTILNPSNPHKVFTDLTARLGRWHHVFPRPLHASNIKWKSLCSPASIPLTTEDFPSLNELKQDYSEGRYSITPPTGTTFQDGGKACRWLIREMISARFCHGFQIVVGARISHVLNMPQLQEAAVFSEDFLIPEGSKIYMSRGSQIHCLSTCQGDVAVEQYIQRSASHASFGFQYKLVVRTSLAGEYVPRDIKISPTEDTYDWLRLDEYIAHYESQRNMSLPEHLRYWRVRFVLIPMQPPSHSKRRAQTSNEDNEEEVRLEGIRKLTQVWQKNRFVAPEERRFQSTSRTKKDPNPLDIIYRTRHPSAVVEAELNETLLLEDEVVDGKPTQLLPDSDRFERSNLNLASLAQAVQSDRGVKMIDRRWHLKLHYNCFIGLEFTTWLLDNFRDVDSREEAVELGNDLMKGGLFVHVEKRHNFRDGNFFYQIANDYRAPRAGSRSSWFGRMSSVPSTPIVDNVSNSSSGLHTRPNTSDEDNASDASLLIQTGKTRPSVVLSKSLVYDVDYRKRSYRQELVTIHYDRISSADDCYHLRIDWMNVTPKLIDDAVTSWATLSERYGLRLVQLPIDEASRVNELHPFRGPYVIRLARPPPEEQPQGYFDNTSLGPTSATSYPYHKELLKRFNFVLDLEAAKDFPSSVDVSYSWGSPEYRYPQFISRDGVLLAQITEGGDFLLFTNRLYNYRGGTAARDAARTLNTTSTGSTGQRAYRSPVGMAENTQRASPQLSPCMSPNIHSTRDFDLGLSRSDLLTPENIKNELEAFCLDPNALEKFFDEVLQSENLLSESGTPLIESITGPLGLPPALNLENYPPPSGSEISQVGAN